MGLGALSPWHLLIVAAVAIIVFGYKRLPEAARGLGRALRIFKSEINELHRDDAAPQERSLPQHEARPSINDIPNTHSHRETT